MTIKEILEKFTIYKEEHRASLNPAQLFVHDFIAWSNRHFLLYGYESTQKQIGKWLDKWIEEHPELKDKLFLVEDKQ